MVSKNICSMVIKGTLSAAEKVCELIVPKLEANNFSRDNVFAVHLALEEACVNAIKHGNKMNADKEIKIDYSVNPNKAEISIMDEGDGFEPDSVPDPRYGKNLYKPDGRGLFLIRSYMDVVKFNERGNCVRMVKYRT